MEKIRLGDIEGIRYEGRNYIPQVACREDLQTLYNEILEPEIWDEEAEEADKRIKAIVEKWGLGD